MMVTSIPKDIIKTLNTNINSNENEKTQEKKSLLETKSFVCEKSLKMKRLVENEKPSNKEEVG